MNELTTLYGQHTGRVSQRWSSYLDTLDRVLAAKRTDPISLLEIGVQNGGSLELWARYFCAARILIGSDIDERCGELTFEDDRIRVVVGDATEAGVQQTIASLSEGFDVVIDDGSHRSPDIIAAFIALYPRLAEGGVYIIEDLHCSYAASFGGGLHTQRSALGFLRRLIDVVNQDHWGLPTSAAEHLQSLVDEPLPQEFLASLTTIASLEFFDSVCVVRRDGGPSPRLGTRIVAGSIAAVDPAPFAEAGRPFVTELQVESLADPDPIEHEAQLRAFREDQARLVHQEKVLRQELVEVWGRLERILASPSYRIMNVPRSIFRALFRRSGQR